MAQIVNWAVARAVLVAEGMTVGGMIPSLAVAVVELEDLVCPRRTLDVAAVGVPKRAGLSRPFHQTYVSWATAARARAEVTGRVCDGKMDVWGGQHSQN